MAPNVFLFVAIKHHTNGKVGKKYNDSGNDVLLNKSRLVPGSEQNVLED